MRVHPPKSPEPVVNHTLFDSTDFKLIYGHVLAQKLTNESTSDVATAVQVFSISARTAFCVLDTFICTCVLAGFAGSTESSANSHKHSHTRSAEPYQISKLYFPLNLVYTVLCHTHTTRMHTHTHTCTHTHTHTCTHAHAHTHTHTEALLHIRQ